MFIQQLFISPGHNYFGHHMKPPGEHLLVEVDAVECVAGCGIRGDRFFDHQANYQGQITFFSVEVFWDVCKLLRVEDRSPGAARRNVVTSGIDLNSLVGKKFTIEEVEFKGVCECKPCYWMDRAIGPGAEQALHGRGGLRARILNDGILRVSGWTDTASHESYARPRIGSPLGRSYITGRNARVNVPASAGSGMTSSLNVTTPVRGPVVQI